MKKIHYSWLICGAGTLLLFITMGTISNGFSVSLPYIMESYNLTHAQTSSLITLRCLVAFFAMLVVRIYYRKLSMRLGTAIAALFAAVSFLIYSMADSYLPFCIGAAVSGLSYGLGSMIPVSILMNTWFVKRKALSLSICSCGTGLATVILPPICTVLIENISLRASFIIEFFAILMGSSLIFLVIRDRPEDIGMTAYGTEKTGEADVADGADGAAESETDESEADVTAENKSDHALRTFSVKTWIMLGCVSLFMGGLANPGFSHLSVLYTDEGFPSMTVATLISICGVMLIAGKLLYGNTTDRLGGFKSSIIFGSILFAGNVLCCTASAGITAVCICSGILLGTGYAIATIGPSVWANDLVSPDSFASTVQKLQVIYAGGALLFSNLPGIIADISGSYIPAYIMFSACSGIAVVLLYLSYKQNRR